MSRTLLSLCLCGAALATANILILQRPTCPVGRTESSAADKGASSTTTDIVSTAKGKPPQASKAAALSTASSEPPEAKRSQAERPAAKPPAPASKNADVTGSVKQPANTQKPAPPSQDQLAAVIDPPAKVEDEPEEWADVTLAARAHNAPSVSAPIVRYYRLGTRLKVVGRESGWIKVVDPTTSKEGWIYEKYLTPRKGRDQKSSQAESEMLNHPNIAASPQGGSDARQYRPRKSGWRWYRWRRSAVGFAINVYPGW